MEDFIDVVDFLELQEASTKTFFGFLYIIREEVIPSFDKLKESDFNEMLFLKNIF